MLTHPRVVLLPPHSVPAWDGARSKEDCMAACVDFFSSGAVHLEPVYETPRDSNCVVCSSVFIFVDFAYCLMMGSYLDITEIL